MTCPSPDHRAPGTEETRLAALVASRICHDLANPIGAISNGVELLGMAGAEPGSAELALVSDSVAHAAARLRFLRVAYGLASPGQALGRNEIALILQESFGQGRLRVHWTAEGADPPRAEARLAFLLLQCLETALPRGGDIHVGAGATWRIEARAERIAPDEALWSLLGGGALPEALRPAEVQFACAPLAAAALGRAISWDLGPAQIALRF